MRGKETNRDEIGRGKRGRGGGERERTSGLDWISSGRDSCVCCVFFLFFAVVALLPCGANVESMCVMSGDGSSQHPNVASRMWPPPLAKITKHALTVHIDMHRLALLYIMGHFTNWR